MKDTQIMENSIYVLVSDKNENKLKKSLSTINHLLSRYFIGLVFQISILFVIYTITLLIFGIENAVVIAFLCALLNLIPYIGPLVGGVLIPGAEAPKLVTRDMIKSMKRGSVIVDVAIDQGGCVETSKPTTHGDPTYIVDDVVHYCVTNMPGAVARTSTQALENSTLPFTLAIANKGYQKALLQDKNLLNGLNIHDGKITHPEVAKALDYRFFNPVDFL